MTTLDTPNAQAQPALDVETARTLYLEFGKHQPDWSLIRRHYHPDVQFKDAIGEHDGFAAFQQMYTSFTRRYVEMSIEVHRVMRDQDTMFLHWSMRVRPGKRLPLIPVEGATRWDLDGQDLVIRHRDFYDLWGDTMRSTSFTRRLFDWLMTKFA